MDWEAFTKAILLCMVFVIIEAFSFSRNGKVWFENLKQPKFSFPLPVWYVIEGVFYLICGTIAYRLFANSLSLFSFPITLLALMMLINALTNIILFKLRLLKLFYWILYPFTVITIILFLILLQIDIPSAGLLLVYLIWLAYDFYYFRNLRKLN